MHKVPIKRDTSLCHSFKQRQCSTPKKNRSRLSRPTFSPNFIVLVAKGPWVSIVQKQDGKDVFAIRLGMTSLLIHGGETGQRWLWAGNSGTGLPLEEAAAPYSAAAVGC